MWLDRMVLRAIDDGVLIEFGRGDDYRLVGDPLIVRRWADRLRIHADVIAAYRTVLDARAIFSRVAAQSEIERA